MEKKDKNKLEEGNAVKIIYSNLEYWQYWD